MAAPTAAALLERLRAIYEAEEGQRLSDEKLAARLPIALSTFNRWKKGDTRSYRDLMEMLAVAGWLNTAAVEQSTGEQATPPADPLERIAWTLAILARNQSLALDALGVPATDRLPLEPESPPQQGRPTRKTRRGHS